MFTKRRIKQYLQSIIVLTMLMCSALGIKPALAAGLWYVSPTGLDSNSCMTADAPCVTINGAIGKATAGDTIEVAIGTYTPASDAVVTITKDTTLSGGWNADFTAQTGLATIDGLAAFRGVTINDGLMVTIDHFAIQHGAASSQGGGINNRGTLTLSNSIVRNNSSGWMGGGINLYGTLTVNNSTISDNSAGSGGSGGGGGGGIEVYGGSSTATLNNSTVSGNQIIGYYSGSAIDSSGTVFLNNSTISGNTGAEALETFVGHIILNNSTVVGNSGGIDNNQGTVSLRNSILSGNPTNGTPANCTGSIGSAGYNLIGIKNSGCTFTAGTGDKVGTVALPLDPMLGPLADNGGPTFTHALTSGSPAIGAGNPADPGSGAAACLATDQRGTPRLPLPDGGCDMGAYELQRPYVISITRADLNPSGAATVNYLVTFSGEVTGVDTTEPFSDFGLAVSGVTGAAVTAVSGSGSNYIVAVNTGTGAGTLRLDVIDDDTIQDATSGNPLGGSGTGNGNFFGGQVYTMQKPVVSAVTRVNANPTAALSVQFMVIFSQPVTGVDTTAPFSDFSLATTGVMGASINDVSGSDSSYTVTVGTGSRNGTIRLNVVDDDTIVDERNMPLGGAGTGNGNFTSGQTYTISKTPVPLSPAKAFWDTTPTYQWSKVPGATQYRYQLLKGPAAIYTRTVLANICGIACSNTPTTLLVPGVYRWRVQAQLHGVWTNYSAYQAFTLLAPRSGLWKGDIEFYVSPSRLSVDDFALYVGVNGCGVRKITHNPLVPINGGKFQFTGTFFANGTFSSASINPTSAAGSVGLHAFFIPGCGYVSGGPYPWSAMWRNASQPSTGSAQDLNSVLVSPALSIGSESGTIWTVSPNP